MVLISARLEPLPLYFIIRSRLWICMFIIINHSTYTDDHCLYNEYSLIKKTKKQKKQRDLGNICVLFFQSTKKEGTKDQTHGKSGVFAYHKQVCSSHSYGRGRQSGKEHVHLK